MTSFPLNGKNALITGASSGIGASLARILANAGVRVYLTARREQRLELLATEIRDRGGLAEVMAADLALPNERVELYERISAMAPLDILVNNAGLGWYGYYQDMGWELANELIQVNVTAAAHLARLCLPGMLQRGGGHIVNVSSVVGSLPSQGVVLYSASKAFLDAFSTSLHRELRGSGVFCSLVCPGPVNTEFYELAAGRPGGRAVPAERFMVSAERVSRLILHVLRKPRRVTYVPWILGITPWIERSFGWIVDRLGPLLLMRSGQ